MITEKHIRKLAEAELGDSGRFIVEIKVSDTNSIHVFIDSDEQITVADCISVSRAIEGNLDRDAADFDLHVSSAGLDKPFKMLRQYKKYIGKKVEIQLLDESKISGILLVAEDDHIIVTELVKKGKHRKDEEGPEHRILLTDIKATRPGIEFKK